MKSSLFSINKESVDKLYSEFRSREDLVNHREELEKLWKIYSDLADRHFLPQFAQQFLPRFWEMKLGCVLMEHMPRVERVGEKGPDFRVKLQDASVTYIEATCPGKGVGVDKVKDIKADSSGWVPVDNVILRLRSVLEDKHKKYGKYLNDGIMKVTDPFVIAISGCGVPYTIMDVDPPYIVQALFPLGTLYVSIDSKKGGVLGQGYLHQKEIIKEKTRSPVSKDVFLDPKYSSISAVIYSQLHPYFIFDESMQRMKIVHNRTARNPLPKGFLPIGFEYWYEEQKVRSKKYVST